MTPGPSCIFGDDINFYAVPLTAFALRGLAEQKSEKDKMCVMGFVSIREMYYRSY